MVRPRRWTAGRASYGNAPDQRSDLAKQREAKNPKSQKPNTKQVLRIKPSDIWNFFGICNLAFDIFGPFFALLLAGARRHSSLHRHRGRDAGSRRAFFVSRK